jgi:hypothetical protein
LKDVRNLKGIVSQGKNREENKIKVVALTVVQGTAIQPNGESLSK